MRPATVTGHPCLRMDGDFFASLERGTSHLIVKLPSDRVAAMVRDEVGRPFAPNGRVFREWVVIPHADEELWRTLLSDAKRSVSS